MFDENTPGAKEELFAWLRHMNKYKGSDLFITTNFPPAMKVDGKITRLSDEPLSAEKCLPNKSKNFLPPTNATSPSACPIPAASVSMQWFNAAQLH